MIAATLPDGTWEVVHQPHVQSLVYDIAHKKSRYYQNILTLPQILFRMDFPFAVKLMLSHAGVKIGWDDHQFDIDRHQLWREINIACKLFLRDFLDAITAIVTKPTNVMICFPPEGCSVWKFVDIVSTPWVYIVSHGCLWQKFWKDCLSFTSKWLKEGELISPWLPWHLSPRATSNDAEGEKLFTVESQCPMMHLRYNLYHLSLSLERGERREERSDDAS